MVDSDQDDDMEAIATMIAQGKIAGFGELDNDDSDVEERCPRKRNKLRDFDAAWKRFERFYFSQQPVYSEQDFETRFRMPTAIFHRIEAALRGKGEFKVNSKDATGKPGASPRVKIIAALRVLAYGMSFDQIDELCELGHSTTRKTFLSYLDELNSSFREEYLRAPNSDDLKRILSINESRGFPGSIGSWDCQHWSWKNCPVAWAGQFKGKEKKPTVVLEAIADPELFIWGCHFGSPGSMNDINVLDCSTIVEKIIDGRLLPEFEFEVNGRKRNMCYYLVDGIYPKWAIFIDTIPNALARKQKTFSGAQEAARKDVERAFGVLIARWHILSKPCNYHDKAVCKKVMEACIIMHNMVVEARRDGYASRLYDDGLQAVEQGCLLDENGNEKEFKWLSREEVGEEKGRLVTDFEWATQLAGRQRQITDEVNHYSLKQDLIEHIWNRHGDF